MYIGDYLGRRELYSPDRLAIIDYGKTPALRLNFREFNARANRFANWLQQTSGIKKGDRVAILARDGVEHLDCFHACSKLGAVHTALNWRLHWRETLELVKHTAPKVILYSDDFKAAIQEIQSISIKENLPLKHFIHLEGTGINESLLYSDVLAQSDSEAVTCETLDVEDTACLLFTGGTTGVPRGAKISHRMIVWNILNTFIHDITHNDIYLNVFPLFHTGGLFTYLSSQVVLGNTTILLRQFEPERVLELIEKEKVTVFAGVPTMYQMLTQAKNWSLADLSSLRFCTSGGAPLPVPLVEKYTSEKGIRFKQGFGMTEFGPGLFALAPEDAIRKAGSIGRPNFFVDVRVVDENNQPLGPNTPGELVLKGKSGFSGYFNDPETTQAVFDDQGWFHTGDIVRFDEEWYFYVLDRKKDMFISGGENIYPVEIEAALYRHPSVHMCAVVGIPDSKWGEIGVACVVPKTGMMPDEAELISFLLENLARFKVPKRVVFMESLPLSGMGKILKRELRDQITQLLTMER
jgi:fatty-acyl-CoA synthase